MLDNDIKTLIRILEESNIDELEVSTFWGRQNIRIRKKSSINDHNIEVNNIPNQISEEKIAKTKASNAESLEEIRSEPLDVDAEQESNIPINNTITIATKHSLLIIK